MKKPIIWLIVLVCLIGVFIFSYRQREKKSDNTAGLHKVRIAVNPWIGNGINYVAQEKGFFKDQNLDVEITDYGEGAVGKQLIGSGQVDGIVSITPETVQVLNDAGVPVKIVGAVDISDGADGIVAAAGINKLEDLRGRTLAYETGSPSHLLLSYLLDQAGIDVKDIKVVNQAAPDAGASFVAGKVDAAVTWEPWLSKAKERPGGHVIVSTKDLPLLVDTALFRQEFVEQHPEDIARFMKALFIARDYIISNPDDSYNIIAKRFNIERADVDAQVGTFKWLGLEDNKKLIDKSQSINLYTIVNRAGDLWARLGLIGKKTDAEAIINIQF